MPVPKLDKNASILAGSAGAVACLVVVLMGTPVSTAGHFFLAMGLIAMAWAAYSRLAAYS